MNDETSATPTEVRDARLRLRLVPAVSHVDRHIDTAPPWTVPDEPHYLLDRDGGPPPAAA